MNMFYAWVIAGLVVLLGFVIDALWRVKDRLGKIEDTLHQLAKKTDDDE